MWVQAGLPLRAEFTGALGGTAAAVRDADFAQAAEQARIEINAAIAAQTAGKIADLLPPQAVGPLTRLVLASAVYLRAAWAQPFPPAATDDAPFHPGPGAVGPGAVGPGAVGPGAVGPANPVGVRMMHRTAWLGYLRGTGYQAVTLPYTSTSTSRAPRPPRPPAWWCPEGWPCSSSARRSR
jgi:Serpin (serine protease inhibitor)